MSSPAIRVLVILTVVFAFQSHTVPKAWNYFNGGEPVKGLFYLAITIIYLLVVHLANNLWRDVEQSARRERPARWSSSQSEHGTDCPCAWCRVGRDNAGRNKDLGESQL